MIYNAKHSKKISSFIILWGLVFFGVIILKLLLTDELINLVKLLSNNDRLTVRLITLIAPESIEADMFTITGRTDLYWMSVQTWLSSLPNFLFGIGDHRVNFGAASTGIIPESLINFP